MNKTEESYLIRPLEEDDFDRGYLSLVTAMCHTEITMNYETFKKKLEDTNGRTLVIQDNNGKLVGHGSVFYQKKVHYDKMVGYIEDIFVDGSLRGKKLGSLMIDALTKSACEAGCYKITLCCYSHVVPFYQKCGYQETGVEMRMRV